MTPRDVAPADLPALLALNNAHAAEVNALTAEAMSALLAEAFAARAVGEGVQGFLVALDHRAPAQGPNHGWFLARHAAFAYVDRVVVAQAARGRGLARRLYADLEALARAAGLPRLCCEVNLDPPNPVSMAFHTALGFAPVGEATDPRNGKRVLYLERALPG